MENIPRVLEKEIERMTSARGQARPPRRWQMLVVGERGRVYTIKHFRALLALLLTVTAAAAAVAVGLYLYYQRPVAENRRLTAEIDAARAALDQLRGEKELLMARLARTKAMLDRQDRGTDGDSLEPGAADQVPEDEPPTLPESPPAAKRPDRAPSPSARDIPTPAAAPAMPLPKPEPAADRTDPVESGAAAATAAGEPAATEPATDAPVVAEPTPGTASEPAAAASNGDPVAEGDRSATQVDTPAPPPPPPVVAVDDLEIIRQPDRGQLKVRFKISKIDAGEPPVRGYAFVLVGSEAVAPDEWLVFPDTRLTQGRPVNHKRGRFFSIARFNTIGFSPHRVKDADAFDRATVLVYDENGSLLLEEPLTP